MIDLNEITHQTFKSINKIELTGASVLGGLFASSERYDIESLPLCMRFTSEINLLDWHNHFDFLMVQSTSSPEA